MRTFRIALIAFIISIAPLLAQGTKPAAPAPPPAPELFDFVDDFHRYGEPDYTTTLAVTAIRRDCFLNVMGGKPSGRTATMESLPPKTAEVDGIAWLPRLIVKARLKLRGEMPADLMYGCGGDRPFLRQMKMDLPGFLKLVWERGDDDRRIVEAVKKAARG